MIGVYSLFWNFWGGGIVSTLTGSWVRGNCRFRPALLGFFIGRCAGETLHKSKMKSISGSDDHRAGSSAIPEVTAYKRLTPGTYLWLPR